LSDACLHEVLVINVTITSRINVLNAVFFILLRMSVLINGQVNSMKDHFMEI